jgi:hypothetical protein
LAKKLKRSLRLAEHCDIITVWLRVDPRLSLDEAAGRHVSDVAPRANSVWASNVGEFDPY